MCVRPFCTCPLFCLSVGHTFVCWSQFCLSVTLSFVGHTFISRSHFCLSVTLLSVGHTFVCWSHFCLSVTLLFWSGWKAPCNCFVLWLAQRASHKPAKHLWGPAIISCDLKCVQMVHLFKLKSNFIAYQ